MAAPMNVWMLCTVEAGLDILRTLLARGVRLTGVIGLSARGDRSAVAGFVDLRSENLPEWLQLQFVDDYSIGDADRERLSALDIDVLIVAGWQRLIPGWLIQHCRRGVLGMHGSPAGITGGRGRSPQNWALICGAEGFEMSLFSIDEGVDAGPVIASRRFSYTPHDDIVTSYQKSVLVCAEMLENALADWDAALAGAVPQHAATAAYYPQRLPEDGVLDWRQPAEIIRRQVAALTRPYPGAWSRLGSGTVRFWRARPLGEVPLRDYSEPGQIVQLSSAGSLIVRCGDGCVFVDEYSADEKARTEIRVGAQFDSVDFQVTMSAIVDRHKARRPEQPLSSDVLALLRQHRRSS